MTPPEEQFTDLQKLLGCKRYEQPPPGYFHSFSDRVIARLEAEEVATYSSWWNWLVDRFDAKPVLVCAYGLAVSGLLFMGFWLSQLFESELTAAPAVGGPWLAAGPASPFLLAHDFTHADIAMETQSSTLSSSRWAFREEPSQLLLPASSLELQPVNFVPQGR